MVPTKFLNISFTQKLGLPIVGDACESVWMVIPLFFWFSLRFIFLVKFDLSRFIFNFDVLFGVYNSLLGVLFPKLFFLLRLWLRRFKIVDFIGDFFAIEDFLQILLYPGVL